jgi:hypothetical protein
MMMMTATFHVDNSSGSSTDADIAAMKLVGNCALGGGEKRNNIAAPAGGCPYSQFVHGFCPGLSPFQDLLEHMVVAVDVVIFFSQGRNRAARM